MVFSASHLINDQIGIRTVVNDASDQGALRGYFSVTQEAPVGIAGAQRPIGYHKKDAIDTLENF